MGEANRWFADLLVSLAFTAGTVVFALGVPTLLNLYHGELSATPHNRAGGRAYVAGCQRLGPGFGYWWQCQIYVSLNDAGNRSTTLPRGESIGR